MTHPSLPHDDDPAQLPVEPEFPTDDSPANPHTDDTQPDPEDHAAGASKTPRL